MEKRVWFAISIANRHRNEFRDEIIIDGKYWMTINSAADYVGVHPMTIRKYIKMTKDSDGEYSFFPEIVRRLMHYKGGKSILLRSEDVICFKHAYNFINLGGNPKKMTTSKMKNIYFPHATMLEYMFLYCEGILDAGDMKVYSIIKDWHHEDEED